MAPTRTVLLSVAGLVLVAFGIAALLPGEGSQADPPAAAPPTVRATPDPSPSPEPSTGGGAQVGERLEVSTARQPDTGGQRGRDPRVEARPARRAPEVHPERQPFVPTGIELDGVSVAGSAPVDRVATEADGSLGLPENPGRLGWWSGGSAAGAPYGSVVLAGHLDSRTYGVGFASRLSALRQGDRVLVTGTDRQRAYRVRAVYLLPRTRLRELGDLFSARGRPRLVLITCGGSYDQVAGAYSDNLVVEADPVRL